MGWIKDNNLAAGTRKVDNHRKTLPAKIDIRQKLIAELSTVCVLDAFAGAGKMHREVWHLADHYTACDTKWYKDQRTAYVVDNRRLLRTIDLQPFNVFDLDAYGSPWEQVLIIASRRRVNTGERIAFALTDGSPLNLKMGGLPTALRLLAGFDRVVAGGLRLQDEIIDRVLLGLCERMHCRILRRWEARGKTGSCVRYTGIVLEGLPA